MSASRLVSQSRLSLDNDTSMYGGRNPKNISGGQYPVMNFKQDEDFAIKILDNMIQVEEDMA